MKKSVIFLTIILAAAGFSAGWFGFNFSANKVEEYFHKITDSQEKHQNELEPWDIKNLKHNYSKHRAEFPEFKTIVEYGKGALEFFHNPPEGTEFKVSYEGDRLYYYEPTNTFGAMSASGVPKIFMRHSTGRDYWEQQR